MSEEMAPAEAVPENAKTTEGEQKSPDVEKEAFLDRLNKESSKRKAADERAAALETKLADLQAQIEEREHAGLPELERERRQREQLEKRLADAEQRAAENEKRVERTMREQWVAQAASTLNFANPARAAKLIDNLDDIEDADQAERAVKRLAKSDPYLVKSENGQPQIGRVLENGRAVKPGQDAKRRGQIDTESESQMIADQLKQFTQQWQSTAS